MFTFSVRKINEHSNVSRKGTKKILDYDIEIDGVCHFFAKLILWGCN